jgi:tetratricopeptide (TPR) repeat protein
VQLLVARAHATIGRLNEAGAIATRAMQTFPNDPDPAKLAYAIHSAAGKWQEAKFAAQQWRMRTLENPRQADLAIAEAQCRLGDANDAVATLSAYAAGVKADPRANVQVTMAYCKALISAGRAPQAESILLPLASNDNQWRLAWLSLSTNHATAKSAGEWIDKIASLMPREAGSQEALASTWYDAGQQYNDTSFLLKSAVILNKLTADGNVSARTWMLLASVNEIQGNYADAEQGYRRALKIEPKNAIAQNNLAYLLLLQNRDLEEGLALAKEAVTSPQATAGFYDTLARLYVKARQRDQAVKSFNDALALDPNSIDAMIGLADVMNEMGRKQEAALRLSQIDSILKGNVRLSPMLRQQLDALRKNLRPETVVQ